MSDEPADSIDLPALSTPEGHDLGPVIEGMLTAIFRTVNCRRMTSMAIMMADETGATEASIYGGDWKQLADAADMLGLAGQRLRKNLNLNGAPEGAITH